MRSTHRSLFLILGLALGIKSFGQTERSPRPSVQASETLAHRVLNLKAQIAPTSSTVAQTLDRVLDAACLAVSRMPLEPSGQWNRQYAVAVLGCIDTALIEFGFLYPDQGAVDSLSDALIPFSMQEERRRRFENQPNNLRRAKMISARFPGPFYRLDCDTATFLYLAVAERRKLPLSMVVIPYRPQQPGHSFVRWREGRHFLNWETTTGSLRSEDDYIQEWKIRRSEIAAKSALVDLSEDQALGCAYYLAAIHSRRRHDPETALRLLRSGLDLFPQSLDLSREFAWLTATSPALSFRDHAAAIARARFAVRNLSNADSRDTLAAAYASAGQFDQAIREQRKAIADSAETRHLLPAYRQRLDLYRQRLVYRDPAPRRADTSRAPPLDSPSPLRDP